MSIFLKTKDIQRLEDLCDFRYAQRKMKQYFEKLGKKKGDSLTIYEYARVKGVPAEDLIKAMQ